MYAFRAHREGLENLAYKDSWYGVHGSCSCLHNEVKGDFLLRSFEICQFR